jgi:hypothetical protein
MDLKWMLRTLWPNQRTGKHPATPLRGFLSSPSTENLENGADGGNVDIVLNSRTELYNDKMLVFLSYQ